MVGSLIRLKKLVLLVSNFRVIHVSVEPQVQMISCPLIGGLVKNYLVSRHERQPLELRECCGEKIACENAPFVIIPAR